MDLERVDYENAKEAVLSELRRSLMGVEMNNLLLKHLECQIETMSKDEKRNTK